MGTGKSTVGAALAARLSLPFVDADRKIEARAGLSIPHIFERHGEAHFRALERALVDELCARERCVIATGGGMIADARNRHMLLAHCLCIGLTASPMTILARVGGEDAPQARPMLRGGDVAERIKSLLAERAPAYRELHHHIATDVASPDALAEQIAAIAEAEQLRVSVAIQGEQSYDIVVGDGLIEHLGSLLTGRGWTGPALIISDKIAASWYAGPALLALRAAGIDARIHTMDAGERHKTLSSVEAMYRAASAAGLDRNAPVIALGGGVVGDSAGFAAATYLRGVPFVQVPTTLLAMADSSVGGKVGVDTPFGKNLVGAFKQPDLVVMDTRALGSLPVIELRCGYAEIIKCGVIAGGELYAETLKLARSPMRQADALGSTGADGWVDALMMQTLVNAFMLKRDIVIEDPFERGRRALLNFGHTFGHGIEAWSEMRIKHGYAVALGMVCAARLSHKLGLCALEHVDALLAMLRGVGLPTSIGDIRAFGIPMLDVDAIWRMMQSDKKKRAGKLRFVLMRAPGDLFLSDDVDESDARWALDSLNAHATGRVNVT
jgi:3-dehydroquinate synthase